MSNIFWKPTKLLLPPNNDTGYLIRIPSLGMPKAACFNLARADGYGTANVGSQSMISTGLWADSGAQSCSAICVSDNGTTQDVRRVFLEGRAAVVLSQSGGSTQRELQVVEANLDELVLSYTVTSDLERYILSVEIWSGDDLDGKVDLQHITLSGGVDVAEVVSGLGFTPKLFYAHSASNSSSSTASTGGAWSTGMALFEDPTITQFAITWGPDHGASPTRLLSRLSDNRLVLLKDQDAGTADWSAELAVASGTYSLTHRGTTTGTERLSVLAMDTGDLDLKLETFNTPTSAGSSSVTTAGFAVAGVRYLTTLAGVVNTDITASTSGHVGVSIWDDDGAWHTSVFAEDNVSASGSGHGSLAVEKPVSILNGDATTRMEAEFVSLNSDGYTLNWTTPDTVSSKLFVQLLIGHPTPIANADYFRSIARVGVLNDFWDVTNPPKSQFRPVSSRHQYESSAELQAQLDYFTTLKFGIPNVYFPPGYYVFNQPVTFKDIEALHLIGGGRSRDNRHDEARNAAATLEWIGSGNVGPAFIFDTVPGLVVEGFRFSGGDALNNGLETICRIQRTTAGTGNFDLEFERCLWCIRTNGPTVFLDTQAGASTNADMLFTNCEWAGEPSNVINYAQTGFKPMATSGVNFHMLQCRFTALGTCIHAIDAGRFNCDGIICNNFRYFFVYENASSNHFGNTFKNMHIDGGSGVEYRRQLLKSATPLKNVGPIVFDTCAINSSSFDDHYYELTSLTDNGATWRIVTDGRIRMTAGDRILFTDPTGATIKASTTISAFIGETTSTPFSSTYDVVDAVGMDTVVAGAAGDRVTWGDPIFELVGGENVFWTHSAAQDDINIDKGRLCRMSSSAGGGFMFVPTFNVVDCNLPIKGKDAETMRDKYLTRSGTTLYSFRRVGRTSENSSTTFVTRESASNIPPYNTVSSSAPTVSEDEAAGYEFGWNWYDTTNNQEETHDGGGVWVAGGGGADGEDGRTILSGATAPSAGIGVDGDFYIDTSESQIYGPKTGGAWGSPTNLQGPQGDPGTAGADGTDGNTILSGSGAPSDLTGVDGDFYIDTASAEYFMYGPKAGGTWTGATVKRLKGEQGPAGTGATVGTFRGEWDSLTAYVIDDVVTHEGGTYIAVASSTNSEPPSADWEALITPLAEGLTGVPKDRQWAFARGQTARTIIKEPDEDGPFAATFGSLLDHKGTEFITQVLAITAEATLTNLTVDLPAAAVINGPWIEFDISGGDDDTEGEIEVQVETNRTPVLVGTGKLKVREQHPPAT